MRVFAEESKQACIQMFLHYEHNLSSHFTSLIYISPCISLTRPTVIQSRHHSSHSAGTNSASNGSTSASSKSKGPRPDPSTRSRSNSTGNTNTNTHRPGSSGGGRKSADAGPRRNSEGGDGRNARDGDSGASYKTSYAGIGRQPG